MASTKVQRIMTQPINLIFRFLQSKARIQIWLFEQKDLRIEGRIIVSFVLSKQKVYTGLGVCATTLFPSKQCSFELDITIEMDNKEENEDGGFDEYMNLVLEDAEEVNIKKKSRKSLGRILLKGDNITLMMNTVTNILSDVLMYGNQEMYYALRCFLFKPGEVALQSGMAGYMRKTTCAVGNYKDPGRVQGERSHCAGPGAAVFLDSII
ncbi:hypothetical protein POTOM_025774 [Populus tomentosa]|uniref:Small nuclear ribonucleoprotein E n=1 Tax=Populus tomentosa TaxID=118781 RepID=A0A8X8CNX5_POPTO|nr:hypothetical protein POTOM_025774 [Populus tomentosa]